MFLINLDVSEDAEHPGCVSVKVNGKDISPSITEARIDLNAGRFPVLTVTALLNTISINTRAMWDIPEPYKSYMENEIRKRLN